MTGQPARGTECGPGAVALVSAVLISCVIGTKDLTSVSPNVLGEMKARGRSVARCVELCGVAGALLGTGLGDYSIVMVAP